MMSKNKMIRYDKPYINNILIKKKHNKKANKILIFFAHELQVAELDHESLNGANYNWRSDIFSNLNIEEVRKKMTPQAQKYLKMHISMNL
jgi:hypothetical protein